MYTSTFSLPVESKLPICTNPTLNMEFEPDFDYEPFSTNAKILITLGVMVYEICINPLLLASFAFEKFGGDSQRRTTVNMLTSKMALALCIKNLISLPLAFYGIILQPGGLNYWIGILTVGLSYSLHYFICLCAIEILLFRILYVMRWSSMALTDDYFFSMWFGWMNIILSLISYWARYLIGDIESITSFRAMTGFTSNRTQVHERSHFW